MFNITIKRILCSLTNIFFILIKISTYEICGKVIKSYFSKGSGVQTVSYLVSYKTCSHLTQYI